MTDPDNDKWLRDFTTRIFQADMERDYALAGWETALNSWEVVQNQRDELYAKWSKEVDIGISNAIEAARQTQRAEKAEAERDDLARRITAALHIVDNGDWGWCQRDNLRAALRGPDDA